MSKSFSSRRTHGSFSDLVGDRAQKSVMMACAECKAPTIRRHGRQIYCPDCAMDRFSRSQSAYSNRRYHERKDAPAVPVKRMGRPSTKDRDERVMKMLTDGVDINDVAAAVSLSREKLAEIIHKHRVKRSQSA